MDRSNDNSRAQSRKGGTPAADRQQPKESGRKPREPRPTLGRPRLATFTGDSTGGLNGSSGQPAPSSGSALDTSRESFGQLVARANKGDAEALKLLRHLLDERPDLWHKAGDLARYAEATWVDVITDGSALIKESVSRIITEKKESLLGKNPTAIESLLVDQIIACFLEVQFYLTQADSATGNSLALSALRLKRLESSQKRYLSSIRSLAQLRALVPQGLVPLNRCALHRTAPSA